MTIVPDTNVLMSALLSPAGNEAQIVQLWFDGELEFALSEIILEEIKRVLGYERIHKRLRWDSSQIAEFVQALRDGCLLVDPQMPVTVKLLDVSDEKFLACAAESGARAIVTGDTHHLLPIEAYQGIPILKPSTFLRYFADQQLPTYFGSK